MYDREVLGRAHIQILILFHKGPSNFPHRNGMDFQSITFNYVVNGLVGSILFWHIESLSSLIFNVPLNLVQIQFVELVLPDVVFFSGQFPTQSSARCASTYEAEILVNQFAYNFKVSQQRWTRESSSEHGLFWQCCKLIFI